MRWLRRDIWKAGIIVPGLLLLLMLMVWVPVSAGAYQGTSQGTSGLTIVGPVQATPTVDLTVTVLAKEELTLRVKQLQNQLENQNNWFANTSTALIAAVATVIVALFGISQWAINRRDERRKEIAAQDKELRDRAEERFKAAVAALGDGNEATQVGGAILLRSFLHEEDKKLYERYYAQIFDLAVAYLRPSNEAQPSRDSVPMPLTSLRHALVVVLQESYPLVRDALMNQKKSKFDPRFLNASSICLDGAYLVESDLNRIWMADASLIDVKLGRAKLHKADLRRAIIRNTFLNGADLSESRLFRATLDKTDLSGADLRNADLRGVKLNGAILANANLSGADLGGLTVRGDNIRSANPEDAQSLENTDLRGVKGPSKEQLEVCKAKGAIIDENTTTGAPVPTTSPPASSQSHEAEALSSAPAQVNTPPPSTDGSSAAASYPSAEP